MTNTRQKVVVPVTFTGTVEVEIPAGVPQERCEALAHKVALARMLATTENPDAPEDDACAEDEQEFGLGEATAGQDWDGCMTTGVSGMWSLPAVADDHAAVVERLTNKADSAGMKAEDLDDIVHALPMNEKNYSLNIDGPAFRAQRGLLLKIAELAQRKRPYKPAPVDEQLLDGLIGLTDGIADQAHDEHGIDCLLEDAEDDAQSE